ncbi:MAG: hypothetical protein C0467_16955 [Planctomycetaceae bacterium]|nr:hypothetical protein [Planctomycetaceae bacterium]
MMTRSHKALGFVLVMLVGAWGCSKVPTSTAAGDKNSSQEAKTKRLDEDFRAAAAARDQFRLRLLAAEEKLAAAESRGAQLQAQLDESRATLTAERADLKARTNERDNLAIQYEAFRKNIKSLLGQAESSLNTPANSGNPTSPASPPPPASALSN